MEVPQTPLHTSHVLHEEQDVWETVKVSAGDVHVCNFFATSFKGKSSFDVTQKSFVAWTYCLLCRKTAFHQLDLHLLKFECWSRNRDKFECIQQLIVFSFDISNLNLNLNHEIHLKRDVHTDYPFVVFDKSDIFVVVVVIRRKWLMPCKRWEWIMIK